MWAKLFSDAPFQNINLCGTKKHGSASLRASSLRVAQSINMCQLILLTNNTWDLWLFHDFQKCSKAEQSNMSSAKKTLNKGCGWGQTILVTVRLAGLLYKKKLTKIRKQWFSEIEMISARFSYLLFQKSTLLIISLYNTQFSFKSLNFSTMWSLPRVYID